MSEDDDIPEVDGDEEASEEQAAPKASAKPFKEKTTAPSRVHLCEACAAPYTGDVLGRFQKQPGYEAKCSGCKKKCLKGLIIPGSTLLNAYIGEPSKWNQPSGGGGGRRRHPTADENHETKKRNEMEAQRVAVAVLAVRPLKPPGQSTDSLPPVAVPRPTPPAAPLPPPVTREPVAATPPRPVAPPPAPPPRPAPKPEPRPEPKRVEPPRAPVVALVARPPRTPAPVADDRPLQVMIGKLVEPGKVWTMDDILVGLGGGYPRHVVSSAVRLMVLTGELMLTTYERYVSPE